MPDTPDNATSAGTVTELPAQEVETPQPAAPLMSLEAAFDEEPPPIEPAESDATGGEKPEPAVVESTTAAPVEGQPLDLAALGVPVEEAPKYAGCKTAAEVVARLNKSYRDLRVELNRRAEEREKPASAQPAAPVADNTASEYQRFLAWQYSDPAAANEWYQQQVDQNPLAMQQFITRGEAALRESARPREQVDPSTIAVQAELWAFRNAHPDHAQFEPRMRQIAERMSLCPQYEELYAMAKAAPADLEQALPLMGLDLPQPLSFADAADLAKADEPARQELTALMAQGMAYTAAKELRELRTKKQEYDRAATDRATARVQGAAPVSRTVGARGGRASPAVMPRNLEEAFESDEP
jgi:hypothetical protein